MFDAIGRIFQGVIDFLTPILIPDWRALIDLLPVFLLIGVVGPLLTLLVLGWFVYFVGKPRSRIPYAQPEPRPRGSSTAPRSTRPASRTAPSTSSSSRPARRAAPSAAATSRSSARSAAPAGRRSSTRAARAGSSCASIGPSRRSDPPVPRPEAPRRPDGRCRKPAPHRTQRPPTSTAAEHLI